MNDPLKGLLSTNWIFRGLSTQDLDEVRAGATLRQYPADTFILRQGEPACCHFLMRSGSAKLTHVGPDGHQAIHRYIAPGGGYGIASVLEGFEFHWSVQALEDCQMLVWPGETMRDLMQKHTQIMFNSLAVMVMRRRELQERYMELLTLSVEQRLARALVRLCNDVGTETAEGILINVPFTRSDLADYAGTTVYSVSRLLQKWERRGLVNTGRERVAVLDVAALDALAPHLA